MSIVASLSSRVILERLVAFPTVSRDSNLPLIDWVRDFLSQHGVESHLIRDPSGTKANLIASVGPSREGGLILSGHTDVVPVDDQDWHSDPFTLTEAGSRLHGRGSCDMKGFIAVALSRVPNLMSMNLRRPVHLMLSYDEEVGCRGAPIMIAAARERLPKPAAVIVGEPTDMRIANEHKGVLAIRTRVKGVAAHSSLTHQGHSAVMLAGELIAHLCERSSELYVASGSGSVRCEPPFTTLSVNRIEGGTAFNILAGSCEFEWDIRAVPGEDPSKILDDVFAFALSRVRQLQNDGKKCSIETIVQSNAPPLLATGGPAEELTRLALRSQETAISVPFATEAGQYQSAGWSTVVCGPGSIDQAHKPDEFIEQSQLVACESFLDRAIAHQCR